MRAVASVVGRLGPSTLVLASSTYVAALTGQTANAFAYDAEVDATTIGQSYQLKGVSGEPTLSRSRVTQTLALQVNDLIDASRASAPRIFVRARMRLDGDFGVSLEERNATSPRYDRFVPGLEAAPVDVMYAYVEGQRFASGRVGFRLGRQYLVDPLGFYSFDGALVRIETPAYFRVEAYGGLEVRAGLPLSSGRFEAQGMVRGDRKYAAFDGRYPSFQPAATAPVYGIAVETAGPTWIHGRLTYRKAFNTGLSFIGGTSLAGPPIRDVGPGTLGTFSGRRVSSERIGYGASAQLTDDTSVQGSVVYDLYAARFSTLDLSGDVAVSKLVTASVGYDYWQPTFDADSIWNVFGVEPMDDVQARVELAPNDRTSIAADAMVRRYQHDDVSQAAAAPFNGVRADGSRVTYDVAADYAPGAGLRARYRWPTATAMLRGSALAGSQGRRVGADLAYDRAFYSRYLASGRLSLWNFDDKLRASTDPRSRSATSVGYVIGGGYKLSDEATAMLQFEHDINRLVGQRYRLLAVLNVRVWL